MFWNISKFNLINLKISLFFEFYLEKQLLKVFIKFKVILISLNNYIYGYDILRVREAIISLLALIL